MPSSMSNLDYADKYWLASDGRVYSSSRDVVITATNPIFVAADCAPLTWPTDVGGTQSSAALYALLQPNGFGASLAPAPTKADLIAYAYDKQVEREEAGITVNIGSAATPDMLDVATDTKGKALIAGAIQGVGVATQLGKPVPTTYTWVNDKQENGQPGAQMTLTVTQVMTIQWAMLSYVQTTYATLGTVLAAIAAGTITTTAEIDAAAWPATSY